MNKMGLKLIYKIFIYGFILSIVQAIAAIFISSTFKLGLTLEILLIFLVALLCYGILAIFLNNFISKPIEQIVSSLRDTKDLTIKPYLDREDEIGLLSKMISQYIEQLAITIKEIKALSNELSAQYYQLFHSAEQTSKATEQVSSSIQTVADGSTRLVNSVERANNAITSIIQIVERVANSTKDLLAFTENVNKVSQNGYVAIQKATQQMAKLQSTVEVSSNAIQALGEQSKKIGRIVESITSIASQTNLLALNAAIEAARAGEQGRGFTVVAQEVRKLAADSAQAAHQIGELVKSIQERTYESVQAMQAGTEEVLQSVQTIKETAIALQEISSSVSLTVEKIHSINEDVDNLSENSQTIVKSMDEVSQVAENNAAITEEVAASAQEQTASVQEIVDSINNITELADKMERLSREFKIDDSNLDSLPKVKTAKLIGR